MSDSVVGQDKSFTVAYDVLRCGRQHWRIQKSLVGDVVERVLVHYGCAGGGCIPHSASGSATGDQQHGGV